MVKAWMYGRYFKAANFFKTLREDQRGMSNTVAAVLLILVAVLAVLAIWGWLSGWLRQLFDSITDQAGELVP